VIKAKKTSRMGAYKWQCSANWRLF